MTEKLKGRIFNVGDRVSERPTRKVFSAKGAAFNGKSPKVGEILAMEIRKQRNKAAKAGFSERRYVQVKWDIRTQPEWIVEHRVIHENELELQLEMTRTEV
jgi:hypothetical protein